MCMQCPLQLQDIPFPCSPISVHHPPRLLFHIGMRVIVQSLHCLHYLLFHVRWRTVSQGMQSLHKEMVDKHTISNGIVYYLVSDDATLVCKHLEYSLPYLGDVLPHVTRAELLQSSLSLEGRGIVGPTNVL